MGSGASGGQTALMQAARNGDAEGVQAPLRRFAGMSHSE